jgi:hypothetical protein
MGAVAAPQMASTGGTMTSQFDEDALRDEIRVIFQAIDSDERRRKIFTKLVNRPHFYCITAEYTRRIRAGSAKLQSYIAHRVIADLAEGITHWIIAEGIANTDSSEAFVSYINERRAEVRALRGDRV